MFNLITFALITYVIYSINLSCLTALIQNGYFDKPFWTRSLRACFLAPPFAILIIVSIALKESAISNWENIKFVMKKRED